MFHKTSLSVNANPLQGISESSLAVDKDEKTVADTSKSHFFYPEKCDFLSLKVTLFVCLATELIVFIDRLISFVLEIMLMTLYVMY